jgi:hypothetical protein
MIDGVHGMTWEELAALLTKLGEDYDVKVRRVEPNLGPETIAMHIVPVAWFVAMRFMGVLNLGTYEGPDNRLVGSEPIPLADLTPGLVRERVEAAVAAAEPEVVLNPDAVRDFFEFTQKQRQRDLDPGRFRDVNFDASRERP